MITDKMRADYSEYLKQHIRNVNLGFIWMSKNVPELFKGCEVDSLAEQISHHDESKYSPEEYDAYCEYFYGKKTEEVEDAFDLAWLHHQHNNPHHWQYWLLRCDDGDNYALEMPYEHIIEMVADHWAFSWKADNLYEIFSWYDENKRKMLLHPNTKKIYEDILDTLKKKIDEVSKDADKE